MNPTTVSACKKCNKCDREFKSIEAFVLHNCYGKPTPTHSHTETDKTKQCFCQSIYNGETNTVDNCTCGKCAEAIKPTVEKWDKTHQPVIETMKKIGYGLLKDGETFYQLGYELEPRFGITFTMSQAYVISHSVQEAKAEIEIEKIASNIALMKILVKDGKKGDMERLIKEFEEKLEKLLASLKQEEGK